MTEKREVGVLFVCLGNICRSPTSEGVFRKRVEDEDLDIQINIDSAGTASYHIGQPPDSRAIAAASKRGVNLRNLRARQVRRSDFQEFDYIIAMDHHNYSDLTMLALPEPADNIWLFMDFAANWSQREIPDPYYGGQRGFEKVLDMINDASTGLIKDIRRNFIDR